MSRSRRKKPIVGWTCAESEKNDKRMCNGRIRQKAKSRLRQDAENYFDPDKNEALNAWNMAKDGRQYVDKDSDYHDKSKRK